MENNLSIIETSLKNKLTSEWGDIDFEYTYLDTYFRAKTIISTPTCDDIFVSVGFSETGVYCCTATFDEIEFSLPVARCINKLTSNVAAYYDLAIFVDEDYDEEYGESSDLTVLRSGPLYDFNLCGDIAFDFIVKLTKLTEEDEFKTLATFFKYK